MSLDDWADDHGFSSGTCPRCRARIWSDTSVFECSSCGWSSDPEPEEEEPEGCPICHGEGVVLRTPAGAGFSDDLAEYDPCECQLK